MPDQLAHYLFARRVLDACRLCVDADSPAFRAGTFGPDPLFNDPSPRCRAEAFAMHRSPGRKALERMRAGVLARQPWAAEYAAGFFCHYALDRLCHPLILELAALGVSSHVAIEAAYDRHLMLCKGENLPRRIVLSVGALKAAAEMYRRVGPERLRMDMAVFWQIKRFMAFSGGKAVAAVPGKLRREWKGLLPLRNPGKELEASFSLLDARMESAVGLTARQLERYFEAMEKGLPLDHWTNADFSGFQTHR